MTGNKFKQHPILVNVAVIILVAILGVVIVFLSLNIFTRHGQWDTVPEVENMSFTEAINKLHAHGFRTDIRDSVFREDVKPGYVVEQFPKPGASVKPGRKVFLYINSVHPREVIIDSDYDGDGDGNALHGYSRRQGLAKLEELGFKHLNVVLVPGETDRIIRLLVNGRPIKKMQKVPVNALITVEVNNGQLYRVTDSLLDEEYLEAYREEGYQDDDYEDFDNYEREDALSSPEDKEEIESLLEE